MFASCPGKCIRTTGLCAAAVVTDTSWTFEPGSIALCVVLSGVYVMRWRTVRKEHPEAPERGAPVWRLLLFAAGIATIVVALMSPFDRLAEQLFAMHMVQHVLLLDIAPILLIGGLTKLILRPLTPRLRRLELSVGPLASPIFAVIAYVALMWIWHLPAFYDAAL